LLAAIAKTLTMKWVGTIINQKSLEVMSTRFQNASNAQWLR